MPVSGVCTVILRQVDVRNVVMKRVYRNKRGRRRLTVRET
jgi:hypothetical protein